MVKLNEVWTQDIADAIQHAKDNGRYEIADYLSLRASNDAIRKESIDWLMNTVTEIVTAFNEHGARIVIEKEDQHSFKFSGIRLTGSRLRLSKGVRCLDFEAGWTQTPDDGIMRDSALACAQVMHFGMGKHDEKLMLHRFENKPMWFSIGHGKKRVSYNVRSLRNHFETFLA